MPVKGIAKTALSRNGVSSYVLPCHRVVLQYCNWGGSSQGIRDLLKSGQLDTIARQRESVVFEIARRSGHPKLSFKFAHDKSKEVNIANLDKSEIVRKLQDNIQSSGSELFKWNHKVMSSNESVRGIWSPLHVSNENRFKI
ncbi:Piso0_002798 [Millerozyma farinosa CBS 7064]|uniref:Large ribosomal subunit protein mL43 n=1 Tax=Pichia sorbitophila (strain ATCC MYA-4447 / BCRC 22081 / CBS 7064 / NBRC 10061 / NRRL Y-12695) TaxID=559304 RepID=G8YDJ3_PICSO|nr:Piso0_002798 [Millerozyma farinosa CBS 7064]